MKIARLLPAFSLLMLGCALSGLILSVWAVNRSWYFNERINLAHSSYEEHLKLESHTYQLFKQFADAIIIGDQDKGAGEHRLSALIDRNIGRIKQIIDKEILLVGDEELEELQALSSIEVMIKGIVSRLQKKAADARTLSPLQRWRLLSTVLDTDIDKKFRGAISAALDEEREEVEEARAAAKLHTQMATRLAYLFALIACTTTLIALLYFFRNMIRPFRALIAGANEFEQGNFHERINVSGRNEIADISNVLNTMAARVEERTRRQNALRSELERAVENRTVELKRLLDEAHLSETQRRQLLADVSHELRTPLTIIRGEADIALRGGDKPIAEYREALSRARDAASHTASLVDDLLFIARKEAGRTNLTLQDIDLRRLVSETVTMFDPTIELRIDDEVSKSSVDGVRIRQALLALLSNSRQYGGEQVTVELSACSTGVRISVSDDGPGVSDAEKHTAFERFFRGSNAASQYGEGSGLGLAIVRAIAEAHQGKAWFEDRPGGGLVAIIEIGKLERQE